MTTTKQVRDYIPNPTGKGGFQERPQDRSNGRWNKDESISYQYNKLLRMTPEELDDFIPQTNAQAIAKTRIIAARGDNGLMDTKEITDRVEGKAPQSIDMTSKGESINPYAALTTEELRKLAGK
jgi:hypothetical protein